MERQRGPELMQPEKIDSAEEAVQRFVELFAQAKRVIRKVEVLDDYSGVDAGKSLTKYKQALELDPNDGPEVQARIAILMEEAWQVYLADEDARGFRKMCRDKRAEGVDITRVHLISSPPPAYFEWERDVVYADIYTDEEQPRAEEIYITEREGSTDGENRKELDEIIDGIKGDFWVFDKKTVLEWSYAKDEDGEIITAGATIHTDPRVVEKYIRAEEALREKGQRFTSTRRR